jgi:glycosyltransferase involved in cell wall biosynthesis
VPEEHLWYGTAYFLVNTMRYMFTKWFEKYFIKRADSFSVVSNYFKTYLVEKYDIEKKIVVYPTVFNHQIFYYDEALRETTRDELEILPNEILLTYSGSFQKWQNPDILFRFFSQVLNQHPHFKLLIITYDHEKAHQLIQRYQIPITRSIVRTGAPPEVNAWLNGSDICTLLRKDDLVNRVASPTKFLEYIVTRNKIIMTDHIGDYSEIIKNTNFGLISPDLKLGTLLNLFTRIDQIEYPSMAFIQQIVQMYSIESNINTLLSSFHS